MREGERENEREKEKKNERKREGGREREFVCEGMSVSVCRQQLLLSILYP